MTDFDRLWAQAEKADAEKTTGAWANTVLPVSIYDLLALRDRIDELQAIADELAAELALWGYGYRHKDIEDNDEPQAKSVADVLAKYRAAKETQP